MMYHINSKLRVDNKYKRWCQICYVLLIGIVLGIQVSVPLDLQLSICIIVWFLSILCQLSVQFIAINPSCRVAGFDQALRFPDSPDLFCCCWPGGFSVRHSHWSRLKDVLLSLVEIPHSFALPALLCHIEPAQGTQSPLLRTFLAYCWFFMAQCIEANLMS